MKQASLALVMLPLALLALPAPARADDVIGCSGPIARSMDEAALVKLFGKANVHDQMLPGAEGMDAPGTVLFPADPKRRLEIFWSDEKRHRRPSAITVRDASGWRVRTEDAVPHEVHLGMAVGDVEDANERPFKISGFFWDYGGFADLGGGKLDTPAEGCTLSIRFNPDPKAKASVLKKVSGEDSFSSSDPAMIAAKPTVSEISIGWADE